MKALFTLTLILVASLKSYSQEIEIYIYNLDSVDVSGTTIVVAPESSFKFFSIRNMSGSDFDFRIERAKIMETTGVEDFLTFGESPIIADAFPADLVSPEDPYITPLSHTLLTDTLGYLGCHYIDNGNAGCSQYRYYIINDSDERLDSVDVLFCSTVSLSENKGGELSVFPNPFSEVLNLSSLGINPADYNLAIYDVLGQQVYFNSGIPAQIDCRFLDTGMYSVMLVDPSTNAVLFSQKVVKK